MSTLQTSATRRVNPTIALDHHPVHRRLLYVFTFLAALTSIQILHLALDDMRLNLALSAALLCGFVYSYYLPQSFRALTTYGVSVIAVILFLRYFWSLRDEPTMYGNLLGILLGLLTVLLAFKTFSPGDHRFILMVCVIFLLLSSVASYDLKFMLLMPLFLLFAGFALYISNQIEVAVRVTSTAGSSLQLHFGFGLSFVAMLLRALLAVIALSATIYTFTPHSSQDNRNLVLSTAPTVEDPSSLPKSDSQQQSQQQRDSNSAEVGIGSDFDLTDTRRLSANPQPVLRMKSHRNAYLRAQVYDVYTGSSWIKSPEMDAANGTGLIGLDPFPPQTNAFLVPLIDFPSQDLLQTLHAKHGMRTLRNNSYSLNTSDDLSYDVVRQEVSLLENQPPFYFASYQPFRLENISLTVGGDMLDQPLVDHAATLRPASLDAIHPKGFSYAVYSLEPRTMAKQLNQVFSVGPAEIVSRYTQLPLDEYPESSQLSQLGIDPASYRPISKRMRVFAGQFGEQSTAAAATSGARSRPLSTGEKVEAIYRYLLSPEFTYTRQFTPIDSKQELTEAFCLGTQEGYCRQFASAMAVLCRLNGIPARVVSGYSPGAFSLLDNAYIYHANKAHAWVEVYCDGYGWTTFDPSPTAPDAQPQGKIVQWFRSTVDFLQELFIIDPASTQRLILESLAQLWAWIAARWIMIGSGLAGLLVVVASFLVASRLRRRKKPARFVAENAVVAAYSDAITEVARLGITRRIDDTARSYARLAGQSYQWLSEPFALLVPLYERAAFSPNYLSTDEAQAATELARKISELVRDELARRKRR